MGAAIFTISCIAGLGLAVAGLATLAHHARATRITLRLRIMSWIDLRLEIRRDQ